jgi:viroplasmin and RNaseH domain-containing protein
MTWYVVFCERKQGVFSTWKECHDQVSGYPGACFKGYRSRDEAEEAFQHVHNKSDFKIREEPIKRKNIYLLNQRCNNISPVTNHFFTTLAIDVK